MNVPSPCDFCRIEKMGMIIYFPNSKFHRYGPPASRMRFAQRANAGRVHGWARPVLWNMELGIRIHTWKQTSRKQEVVCPKGKDLWAHGWARGIEGIFKIGERRVSSAIDLPLAGCVLPKGQMLEEFMDERVRFYEIWDLENRNLYTGKDLKEAGCDFPEGQRLVSPWMEASGFTNFKSQDKELIKLRDLH